MKSVVHGHPDHDACGTGFIVQLNQPASHEVMDRALCALRRLTHRGGADADGSSGDGVGLLTEIPETFMRRQTRALGFELPARFAVGMLFLRCDDNGDKRRVVETIAARRGLRFLGWREVPTDTSILGWRATETVPCIWQCFFADCDGKDLEAELFLFRKQTEAELTSDFYFCSLSSRTIVYKGLLTPQQLPLFYPDLACEDFQSKFAIFHQRFSTNTQPSWPLAQPFRLLAHNGEINTIVANRRWTLAREAEVRQRLNAGAWFSSLQPNMSDSASLDNGLELLLRQGSTAEAAMLQMVPLAFEKDPRTTPSVRRFLESSAVDHEPWDGPAALIFSDGRVVGAKLDRNGLRPLRYTRTADGWLAAGSETGIADFDDKQIVARRRLGPGEMLVVDLASGKAYENGELLTRIADNCRHLPQRPIAQVPADVAPGAFVSDPKRTAGSVGWSEDQLRLLLHPLADGREPIWSMGDDVPPAFMSRQRRTLWDYCKQRFAQVTNPPIDPLREAHVMSLSTLVGGEFVLASPVLSQGQVRFLEEHLAPHRRIDITFEASSGVSGALQLLDALENNACANGGSWRMLLISDRAVNKERAALPVLLAAAAVWKGMVRAGQFRVPLVVETGQVIETHSIALLLAAGATAVHPYLALQLCEEHKAGSAESYYQTVAGGLKKVLSRMGISTLASYRNSQLFETVGLDRKLGDRFFESVVHVGEARSLEKVLEDYVYNHQLAFAEHQTGLKDAGLYRYRKEGERHSTSPELMRQLHADIKSGNAASHYEELGQTREPIAVRDLLEFKPGQPAGIDEVEPETVILHRFSTQAMSLGAISPEAHRTLALAMNALGARSNTGEGGEDPDLYRTEPAATNKVKQVASGRFGVTTEYLVHAAEIEIKMAQGSKPGEGGQLPATKVSPYIARLRHAVPGMALISPPPHHDIYSIEDLEQLIHDLREVNPLAQIGVKLVSGAGVGIIAAGVAKAGADVITIAGHDGGTGASPLSSIKNTGLPWEFGLRDTHRTLVKMGSRQRVRLRVDGGLKFARDVVKAALLGADEFGFGTAALLAMGCVMARQCHLNTCPVGIATQDEALRTRFAGKPEMVMAYFQGIAAEVRTLLASLGARSIEEIVGHADYLRPMNNEDGAIWVHELLQPVVDPGGSAPAGHSKSGRVLAAKLTRTLDAPSNWAVQPFAITNEDRSIGAHLSGEVQRRRGASLPESGPLDFSFTGVAGQSFGAFLVPGITFRLQGEANDYVGKGLSGGNIAIFSGDKTSREGEGQDVLAGNAVLYGATSGELYLAGSAGERFAVRNSGALAVVEGVGDHGCEYMTGGIVLVLGRTGINLGSGMTGGLLYVLEEFLSDDYHHRGFVRSAPCSAEEPRMLYQVLKKHFHLTGSPVAARLLASSLAQPFVRLEPLQLPCSVAQTWAPVLSRLQSPITEIENNQYPHPSADSLSIAI
ncbi:MAG TPA: glutamate synthase large subunit [Verrucomicrobiae bacterium]|jgi:glutamate synthase domain-containing protein 2/glutamate synthase domain-containing protein 1/glutamate synthase domain-containing protein 3|nr:glutamate synthase large subunit [Verrucomicrobiae bacterium]